MRSSWSYGSFVLWPRWIRYRAYNFKRQSGSTPKERNGNLRLNDTGRTDCSKRHRVDRVAFVRVVKCFSTPAPEKPVDACLPAQRRREKAKPEPSSPKRFIRLIFCLQARCYVGGQQSVGDKPVNPQMKHLCIGERETVRPDVGDFLVSQTSAMPAENEAEGRCSRSELLGRKLHQMDDSDRFPTSEKCRGSCPSKHASRRANASPRRCRSP
jgi:hypothetical protein